MSDNQVRIDIQGRVDGPGGLKQATDDAKGELKGLREEVKKTGALAQEASKGNELLAVAIRGLALATVAAGAGVTAYGAAQLAAAQAYLKTAAALGDLSEKHDLTVEQLSTMRLEAEVSNTSIDRLGQGYRQLSIRMVEANSGNKASIALFKALGVEWEDGSGKLRNVDAVMADVQDRFAQLDKGAGRTAAAAKLFGKGLGEDLIPWLTQGSDKIAKFRDEAEKMGLKISTETARQAKEFDDNIKVLTLSATGLGKALAVNMIESLSRVSEALRDARKEGGLFYTVMEGLRQAWNEVLGQGSFEQERRGVLDRLDVAYKALGAMNERAAATRGAGLDERDDPPITRRARARLRSEIARLSAERDRLNASLAASNRPGDLGEFGTGSGKKTIDQIPREGNERGGGRGGPRDTGEQLVLSLENRLATLRGETSEVDEVIRQLTEGTKEYSLANKAAALATAGEIDEQRDLNDESRRALHLQKQREDAERRAEEEGERRHDALRREAQAVRDSLSPWAAYEATLKRLDVLYREGLIGAQEYATAAEKAAEKAAGSSSKLADEATAGINDLKNAIEGWGRDTSRALASAAVDGKASFATLADAARNFVKELIAIQIQRRFMAPLLNAGTAAIDSWLNGGGSDWTPSGNFSGADVGGIGAVPYHGGRGPGEFGPVRWVHRAYFERVPRLHSGIGPGEMPAVIRRDESVLTPGQMRSLGAPRVVLQIINQGAPVEAQATGAPRFDGEAWVIGVVLKRAARDAGFRNEMREMLSAPV